MPREPITRRTALAGGLTLASGRASAALGSPREPTAAERLGPGASFGFAALDMARGHVTSVNPDARFPMCSSFKWLLAACVLSRVDRGEERLDRMVGFGPADLLEYAPATKAVLAKAGGTRAMISVAELCAAAVELSDNTAADFLLAFVGGPQRLTAWLRAHGDGVTRLDRIEPEMNRSAVGDPRDTTTPAVMLRDLRTILYGSVLQPASRRVLMGWMLGCRTGAERLAGGLPPGWRIAHKTGTATYDQPEPHGYRNAEGDVGVLLRPGGAPILVAAYVAGFTCPTAEADPWFAAVAHALTADALSLRAPHG